MQARWYSKETGTFLGVDPVVADVFDPQTYNAYAYARNNPIAFRDPTGEFIEPPGGAPPPPPPPPAPDLPDLMEIEAEILAERASEPLVPFHSEAAPPPTSSTQSGPIQVAAAVVAIPPIILYGPPAVAFLYGLYETYMMSLEHPASPIMQKSGDEADAPPGEENKEGEKDGTIYKVPGDSTPSGKPYIGRHKGPNPQKTRRSPDGRDRTRADVVDRYKSNNTHEGRTREQQAIDREGGVDKLDNKRNEIAPSRRGDYGL